ncbi:MAG: hypothetical protein ABH811_00060 [archaeon]
MMIIEVLGKPPEHLVETLENMIKEISEEKGVEIKEKKIKEPTELEKNPGFYTSFAEIEIEVEEILHLVKLMFKYMPAHIDILFPETISLGNDGLNDILNEITRRLHGYDEVARIIQAEKNILEKKLRELMPKEKVNKEAK